MKTCGEMSCEECNSQAEEHRARILELENGLEDAIELIDSCSIYETPYGFREDLKRIKSLLK